MSEEKSNEKTDFITINKLMVSIASQKVHLDKCESVREMDDTYKSVQELENLIRLERLKNVSPQDHNHHHKVHVKEEHIPDHKNDRRCCF